jgi:hypothetical protein
MTEPSSPKGPDVNKKPDAAVEVPVEVLDAEESGASARQSDRSWIPPGSPADASAAGDRGLGRSSAFKSMASLVLAVAADSLELAFPPAWVVIDAFTTLAFFLIWGLRWEIAVVLLPELIPGMNVFPSWTLLAIYLGKKNSGNG